MEKKEEVGVDDATIRKRMRVSKEEVPFEAINDEEDTPERIFRHVEKSVMSRLVAHRGFHDVTDKTTRPLENTINAYDVAWKILSFCECDVQLSKDGEIFLCHDGNFKRLCKSSSTIGDPGETKTRFEDEDVSALDASAIRRIRLTNGTHPCNLKEVLEVAKRQSTHQSIKKMVIEIKPQASPDTVNKLLRFFFQERPDLLDFVGVIMSFNHKTVKTGVVSFNAMCAKLEESEKKKKHKGSFDHSKVEEMRAKRPKFLLLCLDKDIFESDNRIVTPDIANSITTLEMSKNSTSRILSMLNTDKGRCDGFYFQYTSSMIDDMSRNLLSDLCKECVVGVWGSSKRGDPDSYTTASKLAGMGVRFINTDIPKAFSA
eukprot:g156.t1